MKEIPTAEEFLKQNRNAWTKDDLIEFAKLHLEAQRKAIKENAIAEIPFYENGFPASPIIDKQSIDDAYPLNNVL